MLAIALAVQSRLYRLRRPERGQGLVEYTVLVALIAFVCIATLTNLGSTMVSKLYTLTNSF